MALVAWAAVPAVPARTPAVTLRGAESWFAAVSVLTRHRGWAEGLGSQPGAFSSSPTASEGIHPASAAQPVPVVGLAGVRAKACRAASSEHHQLRARALPALRCQFVSQRARQAHHCRDPPIHTLVGGIRPSPRPQSAPSRAPQSPTLSDHYSGWIVELSHHFTLSISQARRQLIRGARVEVEVGSAIRDGRRGVVGG
jgi:hypothetical protein